jgi:pectinesterase
MIACLSALAVGMALAGAVTAPVDHHYESNGPAYAVVAPDGTGNFRTIQAAIDAAPTGTPAHPSVIVVKPGVYHELLYIQREKRYVELLGTDPKTTIVTFNLSARTLGPDGLPLGTFRTATLDMDADCFTMANFTVQNTAGPVGQALALRVDGDRDLFRNCRFLGWQDTIFANRGRQDFDHCTIAGAIDFIFGGATALFDRCTLIELRDKGGDLTAPSTPADQPYGFVFRHCRITASPGVRPGSVGLMRPWRAHGESAFIDCALSNAVSARGWDSWAGREATCRAEEFGSRTLDGQPVNHEARPHWVHWLTPQQATLFVPAKVLGGWVPAPN